MANYTIIEDTSATIKNLLIEGLVPELIPDKTSIGLCTPEEYGDYTVGIYLCDIKESEFLRISGMQDYGDSELLGPPTVLSLSYMIMIHSASEPAIKMLNEHRIMGKIIQILGEHNNWEAPHTGKLTDPPIHLDFLNLNSEEKGKMFTNVTKMIPSALFYRVEPVVIESKVRRSITRVISADFTFTKD